MPMRRATALLACLASWGVVRPSAAQTDQSLVVSSDDFVAGSLMPVDVTCFGADRSPQLSWTSVPESTRSIAVILDEPASSGKTLWLVFDIDATRRSLPPGGGVGTPGTNDLDRVGYSGPCPETPGRRHDYRFLVYGLDAVLPLGSKTTRAVLDRAMYGHVVARGQLLASAVQ